MPEQKSFTEDKSSDDIESIKAIYKIAIETRNFEIEPKRTPTLTKC